MGNDLFDAFSNEPEVISEEIVSMNIGIKKRTGERFAKATTSGGKTYIKTLSKTGIRQDAIISIPAYSTKAERDKIIADLAKKNTQDDIADMLGISQGTVSNSLRKRNNK